MSSMAYNAAAGLPGMLKDGTRYFGDDAVVLRNINACMELSRMLRSSLGPQGRCKLVVNHLDKMFVTSDCAAILAEVPLEHPAVHLLAHASRQQEQEWGDQTNLVVSFGGELLWQTALLIQKMTWQTAPEILTGYQQGLQLMVQEMPKLVCRTVTELNKENLLAILKPVIQSKQYGSEDILAPLIADACLLLLENSPPGAAFPVEAVRTVKLLGAGISHSRLLEGYVATRGVESVAVAADDCKIAVYASGLEASSTEAKGTVVMKTAQDLKDYNQSEERKMKEIIQGIAEAGVQVVVSGGNVSDMAQHFIDHFGLVCLRLGSKWELRRLCQAVGATALVRLGTPLPEELGYAKTVRQEEMGDKTVTVFRNVHTNADTGAVTSSASKLATIVLRASTTTTLADLERAVDDGVQAVARVARDGRLCAGGGCTEMALATALRREAAQRPGLDQYALRAMAEALHVVPRTLAENAGYAAPAVVVADLQAAHAAATTAETPCTLGIEIEREMDERISTTTATETTTALAPGLANMTERGVVDVVATKIAALTAAVDVAVTILKVDQIIMSKPAGGPKPK